MAAQLYKTESGRLFHAGAIAIITVGLPARGKTHTARSLLRYLRWLGVSTQVFHLGDYRRQVVGEKVSWDFFHPDNQATMALRKTILECALADLLAFFHTGGQVGIFDAANTTDERRKQLQERLEHEHVQVQSICDKEDIINANIRSVKISSPDYLGWNEEKALEDFKHRIENHMPFYQTINDPALSYVKMFNAGEHMVFNNINGYLQTRIVYYMMNLHISPRVIYFARNGESLNEQMDRADADLSPAGHRYAEHLKDFLLQRRAERQEETGESPRRLQVWTSPRRRSFNSACHFEFPVQVRQRAQLIEINPGDCDGMTKDEIRAKYPDEWANYQQDSYRYRFPRAESYHDLAVRVEPVILELEREKDDVLFIAHLSVLRLLYAYLMGIQEKDVLSINIPRDTLIEIIPSAYRYKETRMIIPGVKRE
ncbi:bifunctional 6-phosphofructo-2-kinase/fructose-2,6-bisphosphate 2-phosphatase [Thamnocephalis sphaerospora]|uniref:Bifunctional 6-phosphofructo-2-kinase/fructose-2,6-bisphosphate 2-phosphatase n=1 Tax=Thamnocephalis sphaerospora TaxID=78915 RepID=A0A4P9XX68_9FUNG|nr:bifunctional 6-phosphofructo-2-kinase/fructose-2,6-bisphosphate 2-phosphatase [Thamnocephalis sphaerospora]|eukprot:RKP10968.1 bifunctional 6-phosphofructo-2-kinase/fructose-2,6-bisphosphate 2-phosphatase [Thamnocephalis sphaerospora]